MNESPWQATEQPPGPSGEGPHEAATLLPPTTPPVAEPRSLPTIPGYEVLEEIGRGGMGVVYKARHIGLNRLVALKMILTGSQAGDDLLLRFQTEAEAVAKLQHPNTVQIYDIGRHDGCPFIALEYVDGGSLDKHLAARPQLPEPSARLVATLAEAMQAAHEHGIIHRDLKPANVLMQPSDTEGTAKDRERSRRGDQTAHSMASTVSSGPLWDGMPKITDFGLAKQLDRDSGQTKTGAILGTPSYMAPEQASGKKELTPAVDVYALGAILYEMLTGRPPFKAATSLDTVLQVVSEEPVPPRQLQAKVPKDLETICLQCLQKEPSRRYGTDGAWAADLRRWLAGEPILARPAGVVERAVKWVRRRPALAALTVVSVAAALVLVGVVAGYSAVVASKNQDLQRSNEELIEKSNQAERAAEEANAERNRARQAAEEANAARDELEVTLARGLLQPLGVQALGPWGGRGPLTDPEIEALWELAGSRSPRLGPRFVAEAVRSPVGVRQLRHRAEFAVHAAVGLDLGRQAEVKRLLLERMGAAAGDTEQQADVARVLASLGGLTALEETRVAQVLSQAMRQIKDPSALQALAEGLSAVLTRPDRGERSQRSTAAAGTVGLLAGSRHPFAAIACLGPALPPVPEPLPVAELVELLKQPTCTGRARRIVLDQLEHRYGQKFADHWAFVHFAQQQGLGLDFTSPPQRPALPADSDKK